MDAIETLLSAIDIIATKKLDEVSYDITKIGTVIDNSKSAQGIYMIQDGPIKYEAESENPNYRVDEMVRITIPQGDYTQKKHIVGKYTADSALKPITYVSPLETIVNITGNLLNADQASSSFGLIANGDVAEMPIVYVDLKGSKWNAIQNTSIFNTFFVKAKFKCLLDNYKIKGGTYGLRFEFMIPVEDGKYSSTTFEFDNSEMFGDPYAFTIPVSQEKKIVADIGNAEKLFIYLYQKNDFKHTLNGTLIDVAPSMIDNIFVSDIEVGFGANVEDIEDGTLKLFFKNQPASLPYTYGEDGNNVKEFGICWLNKDDDNQYVGFSDGICDPDYDEFEYQENVKQNQEIKAQMKPIIPNDMRALDVAAAINKGEPVIKTGVEILNKKIKSQLSKFKTQLNGIDGELSAELIDFIDAAIESINTNTKDMKASYESILETLSKDEKFTDTITDYPASIVDKLTEASASVKTYLNKLTTDVLIGDKVGFYSIYDLYNNRLTPMLESLDTIVNQLDEIYTTTYSDLTEIVKDDYVREPFEELKIEDTANRYCIYWYEYDYINEVWKLIEEATNIGLPSGEAGKNFPIHTNENIYFVKELNPLETKNAKFKVVLYYNHVAYESNVIEFTNTLQVGPSQEELMGKLTITHGINSRENYYIYGEVGNLVNQADANKPRYLQANFKGYELDNNSLDQAQIFWYIPKNSTMLRYFEIDNKDKFIIDATETNANYTCYYKQIKAVDGIVPDDELQFAYRVKDWYSATKNNDILCRVKKNDIDAEANVSFTFNKFGTCGSDYTLAVSPSDGRAGYTTDPFILEVKLYDYNGNEVEISGDVAAASEGHAFNLIAEKSGPSAYNFNAEKDAAMVSVHKANDNYFGIAEISVLFALEDEESDKRTIRLATNYPIAYAKEDYSYIEGATMVVYDSMGNNPAYYKDPYKLFNQSHTEVEDLTWSIKHYDASGNEINPTGFIVSYLPKLSDNNCLVPCNMFVSNVNCYSVVYAIKDDEIYWAQPIVITQNRYASPVLNSWDGSLTIDEENGTILSTMVGAGRKTTNNTFEGVLMGDIGEGAGLKDGNKSGIGLYGFHDGAQSFGFNIDGTAFLGKSGGGRIHFDGNYGFIYSQNWLAEGGKIEYNAAGAQEPYTITPSKNGMLIDLQRGYIDAYNFKLTSQGIKLNSNPNTNEDYLHIGDTPDPDSPNKKLNYIKYIKTGKNTGKLDIVVDTFTLGDKPITQVIDESITHDKVYNAFVNIVNGVATYKGIYKAQVNDVDEDGNETGTTHTEMLISADYIITGILHSRNGNISWDLDQGELTANNFVLQNANKKSLLVASKDNYFLQSATWASNEEINWPQWGTVTTNSQNLLIRSSASASSTVLGKIPKGGRIQVTGAEENGFYPVKYTNSAGEIITGYCVARYSGTPSYEYITLDNTIGANNAGMKIDLSEGSIVMQNSSNKLSIDSSASTYPLTIGNNFKVSWDGTVTFKGGSFSGGSLTDVSSISAKNFSVNENGINIADKFKVDASGKLNATSIYIGGTELTTKTVEDYNGKAIATYMQFNNPFFGTFLGQLGGFYQYGGLSDKQWAANPAIIYIADPIGSDNGIYGEGGLKFIQLSKNPTGDDICTRAGNNPSTITFTWNDLSKLKSNLGASGGSGPTTSDFTSAEVTSLKTLVEKESALITLAGKSSTLSSLADNSKDINQMLNLYDTLDNLAALDGTVPVIDDNNAKKSKITILSEMAAKFTSKYDMSRFANLLDMADDLSQLLAGGS